MDGVWLVSVGVLLFYVLLGWIFVLLYRRHRGTVRRALFVLLVLFLLDGLVVGLGAFTMLAVVLAIPLQLGFSIWRAFKRDRAQSLAHLAAAGIYVASAVLVGGYIAANTRLAAKRALEVIAACRRYEATHGRLPDSLIELVPNTLPSVPRAKYMVMYGDFQYSVVRSPAFPGDTTPREAPLHVLRYTVVPPFGRRIYSFESDSWSYLD